MSDKQEAAGKKTKARKILLLGAGLVALGGGSAGAALYATTGSLFGGNHGPPAPDVPHLVPRSGTPASEIARYASPTGEKKVDGSKFEPTYYPLADSLTANLSGGDGFVQIGLGVATYYDARVVEHVKLHEMAIRSAVLTTLAEQDAAALSSAPGKERLKGALRGAINDVLKAKEGFGGIDDVYFTNFVIQ
ncbi:flagellar basal body-associated FliL family protein [Allosphingosinicella deserti]|uniref:Flagellar protein FliL n=1 Tax=Allosphingosinicella deserti TaxID=2116704 RepID=A0A2P7QP07_9SPHN|nr:flagellar basal body-associated FliL family protein [Sphingomonas deserti]PSJ39678.1 flagellar basal body protein FliL [Sphingomonas deserti]